MKNQCHRALSLGCALFTLLVAASLVASTPPAAPEAGISGSAAYQQMTKFAGEWTGTMRTPGWKPSERRL